MVLVRPVGTILPDAVAMISTRPNTAHATASTKNRMIVAPIARPAGDAGVSRISSAAGRNWRAVSCRPHRGSLIFVPLSFGNASTDDMEARLHLVKGGVASRPVHELVVSSVLDQPSAFDVDDAVGMAHRRQPMRDDQHRPAGGNLPHVALDDVLALVVQRAGGLVKDQDSRIGNERARDRDPLALPA